MLTPNPDHSVLECNVSLTPLYPISHPLPDYVQVRVTVTTWQAEQHIHAILQRVPGAGGGGRLCVAPGPAVKCIPCSVSWVRPEVSSQVSSPSGPVSLQREILQVPKPSLLPQCFFNQERVLAGLVCARVFFFVFFLFFSWCSVDACYLRCHSSSISAHGA